jgi:hypothetical protein
LVTDANAAYPAFARAHGIACQTVNLSVGEPVRNGAAGAIHVKNVNACHRRFKEWLARFYGVASRWLPITWAGIGRSMVGGSLLSSNCCVSHSRSSTDNDDRA